MAFLSQIEGFIELPVTVEGYRRDSLRDFFDASFYLDEMSSNELSNSSLAYASQERCAWLCFVEGRMGIGHLYRKFSRKVRTRINHRQALY